MSGRRGRNRSTGRRSQAARGVPIARLALAAALALGGGSDAGALVFASSDMEPTDAVPPDFPYWEHVTQRRYEGPTVIYLGEGWALTARHVGRGEISLYGENFVPERTSYHTLMNVDGSLADAMVFELDRTARLPEMALLPIAASPPLPGEEVLMIGFGRSGRRAVQWEGAPPGTIGFEWSERGEKRWGTNRIARVGEWLSHGRWLTRALIVRFDPKDHPDATPHEAQAALGDSGGGVFVRRAEGWELAGLLTSISGNRTTPPRTTTFGDLTNAADLSSYREEIFRWTRPACSNEQDDDGDGFVDYPEDPGCEGPLDRDERTPSSGPGSSLWATAALVGVLGAGLGGLAWRRRQRGRRTPSSTRPSSAA